LQNTFYPKRLGNLMTALCKSHFTHKVGQHSVRLIWKP